MFFAGNMGLVLCVGYIVSRSFGLLGPGNASNIGVGLFMLGVFLSTYGMFMGGKYMTYASRIGKLRTRDRLLDLVAELRPWRGDEAVLDIGCGRGLMVIGAAKRLGVSQRGLAVGIDLWRAQDQSANTAAAAIENACIEGVSERVRIDNGDARALPYADGSFDVELSHWVLHNLEKREDRRKALDEMLRVLRPGDVIALADIAFLAEYRVHLASRKVTDLRFLDGGLEAFVMGVLCGGSFRPQLLIANRP